MKKKSIKTPFYYYDIPLLEQTLSSATSHLEDNYKLHYALKANWDERVLAKIKEVGIGIDCVSGGEVKYAIENGFHPSEIVFAGVGKTDEEIEFAIIHEVHAINCESSQELDVISEIASRLEKKVSVSIRTNPDIEAKTHPNISTGKSDNKFGVPENELFELIKKIETDPFIEFSGLHFHIGSQLLDFSPFEELCYQVNQLQSKLAQQGIYPPNVNLGGGLGINYLDPKNDPIPDFKAYFDLIKKHLKPLKDQQVHFEFGRSLVGQCGSLISQVLFVKETASVDFVILDAGMSELMRPALYQARHHIENISTSEGLKNYEIVGPICESTDTFGKYELPVTKRGDWVRIWSAGAYASVLFSNYNMRKHPQVIYANEVSLDEILSQ